jgi:hypothetical protein
MERDPADMREKHKQIRQVPCPVCEAPVGAPCRGPSGQAMQIPHQARRRAAADAGLYTPGSGT